jgi:flagellar motor switch protein FliN/FliY
MPSEPGQIETSPIKTWLIEEWTSRLASAVGAMAGERPTVSSSPLARAPDLVVLGQGGAEQGGAEQGPADQIWRQPLPPLAGAVWIVAAAGSAADLGAHVLRSLGVEDASEAERKSTFQESINQALAGLAQALGNRLKREVQHAGGSDARPAAFPQASWTAINLLLGNQTVTLQFGLEAALAEAIRAAEMTAVGPETATSAGSAVAHRSPADNSKTFGLLLEVELPVAVSFGRAQIPLKDVLKLTTGSIVELNRAVTEPVEIIVNNCVIARGEVVVVDGNFGVRIQEVINRQERLRSVQ